MFLLFRNGTRKLQNKTAVRNSYMGILDSARSCSFLAAIVVVTKSNSRSKLSWGFQSLLILKVRLKYQHVPTSVSDYLHLVSRDFGFKLLAEK